MRIIAGTFGGRRLRVPKGRDVRPTADRVREAVFSQLGDLSEVRVLDLYAGSGALGLEALSRGASNVVFVERSKAALQVLEENIASLGVGERCSVLRGDARKQLERLAARGEGFDLVFLDPPYGSDDTPRVTSELSLVVARDGRVVLETGAEESAPSPPGFRLEGQRRYGDTLITRYNREPAGEGPEQSGSGDQRSVE